MKVSSEEVTSIYDVLVTLIRWIGVILILVIVFEGPIINKKNKE